MKEIKIQHKLIDLIRKENGYGRKWASEYAIGVPDLVCSLPLIGAFFAEVKVHSGNIRDRDIGVTDKQRFEMLKMVKAGATTVTIAVIMKGIGQWDVYFFHPHVKNLNANTMQVAQMFSYNSRKWRSNDRLFSIAMWEYAKAHGFVRN